MSQKVSLHTHAPPCYLTCITISFWNRQVTVFEPLPTTTAVNVSPRSTPITTDYRVSQTITPKQTNGQGNTTAAGSAASSIQGTGVIWLISITVLLVYFSNILGNFLDTKVTLKQFCMQSINKRRH